MSGVNIDLAGNSAARNADGPTDHVVVNATDGDDTIDVSGDSAQ